MRSFNDFYKNRSCNKDGHTVGQQYALDAIGCGICHQLDLIDDETIQCVVGGDARTLPAEEIQKEQVKRFLKSVASYIYYGYPGERRREAARVFLAIYELTGLDLNTGALNHIINDIAEFERQELKDQYCLQFYHGSELAFDINVRLDRFNDLFDECEGEERSSSDLRIKAEERKRSNMERAKVALAC